MDGASGGIALRHDLRLDLLGHRHERKAARDGHKDTAGKRAVKRQFAAVFFASLGAACAIALVIVSAVDVEMLPTFFELEILDLPIRVLAFSVVVYFHLFAPLLAFSALLALFVHLLKCRSWQGPALSGAILAFGLVAALDFDSPLNHRVQLYLGGIFSGALCGWIYWRIAVRSESPRVSS
jgi:hypothetical protein